MSCVAPETIQLSHKTLLIKIYAAVYSEVCKWWASYLESLGEYQQALQFYEVAKDIPSLVRVLCSTGNFDKAAEVVEESGSRAAAYQLAGRLRTEKEVCTNI